MNKDQIKGGAREAAGKMQKSVGRATANGTQTVKGAVREAAGKVQKAYGNAKEGVKARARSGSRANAARTTTARSTSSRATTTRTLRDRQIERHAR